MDDLQAVTRALVDNGFRYATTEVILLSAGPLRAEFQRDDYSGDWRLDRGTYDGRPETITGLLASIEEA